jgi:oligoribonuclease
MLFRCEEDNFDKHPATVVPIGEEAASRGSAAPVSSPPAVTPEAILWLDVETTGRSAEHDLLLEVAAVLTSMSGELYESSYFHSLVGGPRLAQAVAISSPLVRQMHERSGLWSDLWRTGPRAVQEVDEHMKGWLTSLLQRHGLSSATIYVGGNSLTLDRNFMESNLPDSYSLLSHRTVDVTSVSLFLQGLFGAPAFQKATSHRALDDVYSAINEYHHYMNWLQLRGLSLSVRDC